MDRVNCPKKHRTTPPHPFSVLEKDSSLSSAKLVTFIPAKTTSVKCFSLLLAFPFLLLKRTRQNLPASNSVFTNLKKKDLVQVYRSILILLNHFFYGWWMRLTPSGTFHIYSPYLHPGNSVRVGLQTATFLVCVKVGNILRKRFWPEAFSQNVQGAVQGVHKLLFTESDAILSFFSKEIIIQM